jgi:hypothetical protein
MTRLYRCIALAALLAVTLCIMPAAAQGPAAPAGAAAATPRMPDGHPDLSGMWYRRVPPVPPVQRVGKSIIFNNKAPRDPNADPSAIAYNPGTPTYKPELVAKVKELNENQVYADPALSCGPPGVPRLGPPHRIIQTAKEVVFLYDDLNGNFFRYIPIDGRPHRTDIETSANGDSIGRWDGDTLVVDVNNFNEETWLSDDGLFHSEHMHVVERLRRDGNSLRWDVTVEDPTVLVEPWKMTPRTIKLMTNTEIDTAPPCQEKSIANMQDLTHHKNTR